MKIAAAQINPTVGDIAGNVEKILTHIGRAKELGAQLVVFPELSLVGYPPRDLLERSSFIEANINALNDLAAKAKDISVLVGYVEKNPVSEGKPLYNAAALLEGGELAYVTYKSLLPTYDVFYEARVLFVVHAGEPAVLALTRQVSYRSPGRQRAEAWIFNPRGERVDHLLAVASTIGGGVGWDVGGGRLRLVGGPGGCEVWPDGGPPETVPYQGSNLLATFPLGGRELRREP